MHYPKNDGFMADQLNYVLEKYNFKNKNNTYFSVYNADSVPSENTFNEVFKTIVVNNVPKVMQKYSYAYSNINDLSFIMKGFALYQSNFEIKYGLINAMLFSDFLYTYVVGHGMYIRLDVLEELGGFDSHFWCEDIFISSVLRNKKISITPICALENMENPKFLNIQIRQNAVWFKTSNQWIKMIKANLKFKNNLSFGLINWIIQRIRMNLSWLLVPFLIEYSFVYTILIEDYRLFMLSLVSYLFVQVFTYFTTIYIIEKLENKKTEIRLMNFISVLFSTFISNLGPLFSLFNKKMKKYKTVR